MTNISSIGGLSGDELKTSGTQLPDGVDATQFATNMVERTQAPAATTGGLLTDQYA